jgi:[protein-PII] uridylyltransferase
VLSDGRPRVAIAPMDELHVVTVVAPDRPGLLADIAGVARGVPADVKSALVRTVADGPPGGTSPSTPGGWTAAARRPPSPPTLETELRRLAEGDRRCSTGSPAATPATGRRPARPPGRASSCCRGVGRGDGARGARRRPPGLLHAIGSALAGVGVDLRSAHVATHAGQAVDVLYVSEPDGGRLSPPRVAETVSALVDAGRRPRYGRVSSPRSAPR